MGYMKFNCYDMATQNAELYATHGKLQMLSEELTRIITSLDPQLKNY